MSSYNAARKRHKSILNNFFSIGMIKLTLIILLAIFSGKSFSSETPKFEWSAIENCQCGLGDGVIKNQSFGVLFSQKNTPDEPIGFAIDFSGLNHIAFQVNNNFYSHDYNALMIEDNQYTLPEAEKFIKLAHGFNTTVDLLISSRIDELVKGTRVKLLSAGDIVVIANDIVAILQANKFDGVTIDLERLFNNDLVSYRRLVEEIIKGLKASHKGKDKSVSIIISDNDLLALAPNDLQRDDAQLLFRLLDVGFKDEAFNEVHNRLLIRTNKVRKLDEGSFLVKQCGIKEGPFIDHSLQYSDKPFNKPRAFPANRAYPLTSIYSVQKQLAEISEVCRERYFEEFIIGKYQGLAFEDISEIEREIENELEALGKWFPPEYSDGLEEQVTADNPDTVAVNIDATEQMPVSIDVSKAWSNLSMLAPIQNVASMEGLKHYQHTYLPEVCEIMCPNQEKYLMIVFVILLILALFLFISQVFYVANTKFRKVAVYCYAGFVFLAFLIQIISLCAIKHEIVRNWAFVVMFVIFFVSWIWYRYNKQKEASFP